MKNKTKYYFLLLLAFCGCETVVSSDGLPYVDHLVIRGFLNAGHTIDSISVTQTLPLNVPYDQNQADVPNAVVSISVDGRSIPLQNIGGGFFTDPARDTVQIGKTYSIEVKWNGLHAYASTLIPQRPNIFIFQLSDLRWDTIIYQEFYGYYDTSISFQGYIEVGVRPHPNEAYVIASDSIADLDSGRSYSQSGSGFDYYGVYPSSDTSSDGIFRLFDTQYFDPSDSNYFVQVVVQSFDGSYYDFLRTYNNYYDNSDPFGTGSANPKWNVYGDGIGIFIGEAQSTRGSSFHR